VKFLFKQKGYKNYYGISLQRECWNRILPYHVYLSTTCSEVLHLIMHKSTSQSKTQITYIAVIRGAVRCTANRKVNGAMVSFNVLNHINCDEAAMLRCDHDIKFSPTSQRYCEKNDVSFGNNTCDTRLVHVNYRYLVPVLVLVLE
jgi:hypothetical protein